MDISNFNNIAFLAFLAPIIAFYKQIQEFILKVISVVIRTDKVERCDLNRDCLKFILDNSKIIRFGNATWRAQHWEYIKTFNARNLLITRADFDLFILYKNFIPLIIKPTKSGGYQYRYIYKTFNLEKLLKQELKKDYSTIRKDYSFYITERDGIDILSKGASLMFGNDSSSKSSENHSKDNGVEPTTLAPIEYYDLAIHNRHLLIKYEDIQFNKNISVNSYFWSKEATILKNEIKFWFENKNWFRAKNIAHTRGALLYGLPGTGKSKMVLECAKDVGLPLLKLNISNMTNLEFVEFFNNDEPDSHITLIEDIDSIFSERTNVLAKNARTKSLLSFDTLINTISGVSRDISNFLIVTTNDINKLDAALLRPGRLDTKIEVLPLCEEGRFFIARNILSDWPELIENIVKEKENVTAAEFENYCIELAIEKFYEKRELK